MSVAEKKALERIADAVEKIASAYDLELVEQEPAEIPDFEGTREMIAGLTLGKTAAPGESEGETEGPVTPQSAPGAAEKPKVRAYWCEEDGEICPISGVPTRELRDGEGFVREADALAYADTRYRAGVYGGLLRARDISEAHNPESRTHERISEECAARKNEQGPVTPQSALGAADVMTHYVGDSCPGGHRSEAEMVENKMAEALLKQYGEGGGAPQSSSEQAGAGESHTERPTQGESGSTVIASPADLLEMSDAKYPFEATNCWINVTDIQLLRSHSCITIESDEMQGYPTPAVLLSKQEWDEKEARIAELEKELRG